jgi:hypothetical protein
LIALNTNGVFLVVLVFEKSIFVEAYDHARQVVGAKVGKGVIYQQFRSSNRVLYVSDEVDRFLIVTDIPELGGC